MKRTSYAAVLIALVALSFLSGFAYQDVAATGDFRNLLGTLRLLPDKVQMAARAEFTESNTELPPVQTYWSVFSYLNSRYYAVGKAPRPEELSYAAIQGMLGALGDPYTRFLDPDQNKRMQEENRGQFEGIGAHLTEKDGWVMIKKPIQDSPAHRAGVKAGDIILKVDDRSILGLDLEKEVVPIIRGPCGTPVKLTIKRENVPEPLEIEIIRDVVRPAIVEARMEDELSKIGYIILGQFNQNADQQFDDELKKLESQNMRALILDLRDNPGGLLEVAIDIGSRFIQRGDVVIIQSKGGRREHRTVEPSKHNHRMYPLVVLVNELSASASEIVAGAIQDHKAGTLVGTDTFGKGLVQTIMNVQGRSAVAITTAKYFTPSGRDVKKDKIHPDVVVEFSDEDIENDNDVQLKRAVQLLKERLGDSPAIAENQARKKG